MPRAAATSSRPQPGRAPRARNLAKHVLHVPHDQLRVVSPDVGGGFGVRGKLYAGERDGPLGRARLGRPVKWLAGRTETFQSRPARPRPGHARRDGAGRGRKCLGVRIRTVAGMGAYLSISGRACRPSAGGRIIGTVYDCQAINVRVRCVFTNTVPTDAFRGAGRPETAYVMERLFDRAPPPSASGATRSAGATTSARSRCPTATPPASRIDSGDFAETQAWRWSCADWAGFQARRAARRAGPAARHRHRLLRRGVAAACPTRWARVRVGRGWRRGASRRHLQPRPGPRDRLRPDRVRAPGPPLRPDRPRPGRHRRDPDRRRHGRLPLLPDGRRRGAARERPRGGEGPPHRRPPAGGRAGGRGARRRPLPRRRHRPAARLDARDRRRPRPRRPARGRDARPGRGDRLQARRGVQLPQRLPRGGGGGGPRHRPRDDRALHRGGRRGRARSTPCSSTARCTAAS